MSSMDTIMEDSDYSVSNTNAIIFYGASDFSVRTESLISGPNIPNSSFTSVDDYDHQQQISTAAGGGGGTDDLTSVSSSASSSWFKKNDNKQSDQQEIKIFNVDFGASSPTQLQNYFARDYQSDTQDHDNSFRMFRSDLGPNYNVQLIATRDRRQSMLNRSIAFSGKLYQLMLQERIQAKPHMILESKEYEESPMLSFNNDIFGPSEMEYGKVDDSLLFGSFLPFLPMLEAETYQWI